MGKWILATPIVAREEFPAKGDSSNCQLEWLPQQVAVIGTPGMKSILFTLSMLVLCQSVSLQAENAGPILPDYPILRINTEMHTAQIKRFAIDPAETIIATGSEDKTVKIWDLKSGELVRTIRIPIDEATVGRAFSVDFHPDGQRLAVSGLTGGPYEGEQSLYVFDVKTGELLAETKNLPSGTIEHLAFSPDGSYLASCSSNGVQLFETATWQMISLDDSLQRAMWADWSPTAAVPTVAIASFDGYVSIYEVRQGTLDAVQVIRAESGNMPFCVRYHPEGDLLALGYGDNTTVEVLNASDLSRAYAPDISRIELGDIAAVAWSTDGEKLIAGGRYFDREGTGWCPVLAWDQRGKGQRKKWVGMPSTIQMLSTLSGDRVVIAGDGPYWAVLGPDGERALSADGQPLEKAPAVADFRAKGMGLWTTRVGWDVSFPLMEFGPRYRFSFRDFLFTELVEDTGFFPPDNQSLPIQNWDSWPNPTLDGRPLEMKDLETSRSLAIAADKKSFLLGTEWNLRCFDDQGNVIWSNSAPGISWGVNISPDGRFAIGAFGDGTIRWYRYSDGRPLLAFFPHRNGIDWVCWTPEGYYRASPDGERFIGWHVNRESGVNPDFFSADQLFELFSDEHGILQQVMEEGRPAEEIVAAMVASGKMQPRPSIEEAVYGVPEVSFAGGPDDLSVSAAEWVQLTVQAAPTATDVGVRRIELTNNGKRISESGPLLMRSGLPTQTFNVQLAKGRNELRAVAYSDRRTASYPVTTRVRFDGVRASSDLWIFGVGLEAYQNPRYQILYCKKDVEQTASALQSRGSEIFDQENFVFLPDAEATRVAIEEKFAELAQLVKPEDTFVFIYAGHGTMSEATVERESEFYLVPYDVTRMYGDNELLEEKALPAVALIDLLATIPAQKQVMVLDSCHSGAVTSVMAMSARGAAEEKAIAKLSRATGTAVLASSGAEQFSRGHPDLEHGFFSYAFLQGLGEGKADANGDGSVTINELNLYLNDRVPELTVEYGKPPQYPQSYYRGADFPIGVVGGSR